MRQWRPLTVTKEVLANGYVKKEIEEEEIRQKVY